MFNRNSRRLAVLLLAGLGILSENVLAQKGGTQGSSGGTASPGAASPGAGSVGRTPTNPNNPNPYSIPQQNPNGNNNGPFANRPIFLSGKVMFDDGGPTNSDIRIERVCGATQRLETHTDSKGRFSFQLGGNTTVDTDAADSGIGSGFGRQGGSNSPFSQSGRGGLDGMFGCEIRAAYPGYRSDSVPLANRHSLDDPDVGTIVLHRLANVQGSTISLTTAAAPKAARKDYEKGVQLAEKGKFEEAEKHFLQATDVYPKFAAAWYALGQVQQRENKPAEARKSYEAAIGADKKFVSPYDQLALLSAQGGSWEEALKYSKTVIELNPVEFPSAFWYNAIANYNLKNTAEAEKSAKALLKVDTRHRYPQAESMLAQFAANRGEYAEAATHLRAYLVLAPNAKDAATLKAELQKIDDASAAAKK